MWFHVTCCAQHHDHFDITVVGDTNTSVIQTIVCHMLIPFSLCWERGVGGRGWWRSTSKVLRGITLLKVKRIEW